MTYTGFLRPVLIALIMTIFGPSQLAAAQSYPQANYAPDIPTLKQTVGHDHGEAISSVADIANYFAALESAAPDRLQVRSYGETWQGRELIYAVITAPQNMVQLETVQSQMDRLGSGQSIAPAERDQIIANNPAVVWLSYGVHGDEITPPDSALKIAYHLLAARNDALVDQILGNLVIIIDPSQNPDGRDRFIHSFQSSLGLEPSGDRFTAEHDQPWPRGRFNHYLFDLNRDWFAMTQPETQGKIRAVLHWNPVVYVDSHEMGGDNSYFFPPPARPLNPLITPEQRAKHAQMGRNHAGWFDRFGVPYFTREVYDAFYPGYGDMWPTLGGAIAMTYEQASPRGLVFDRRDGSELTYGEGVRNNFLTSLSTLDVVAKNKANYLRGFADFRQSAVKTGQEAQDRYVVLDRSSWTYETNALAERLVSQGIEVNQASKGSRHCGTDYPGGAFIIDLAQARGRLARTLLAPSTELSADFIAEQEGRRARNLSHQLYDITAWSLPLINNVTSEMCGRVDLNTAQPVSANTPREPSVSGDARFGYAVPWTDGGQARLAIDALKAGLSAKSTDKPFEKEGVTFPAGTIIFPAAGNPDDFRSLLEKLAQSHGASLIGMADSWVESGPNFGSRAFKALSVPNIAMVWGEGTNPMSAGNTRFVMERQLGLPVAPIRLSTLSSADLYLYDVLIIPDTDAELPIEPIRTFAQNGGVVIGLEGALAELSKGDAPLLSTQRELAAPDKDSDETSNESDETRSDGLIFDREDDYDRYIQDHTQSPEDIPGVLARADANPDHWLAAGYDSAHVLVTGTNIYRPLNLEDGQNVFTFAGADELLLSGYLWEENRKQLAYKPFVMTQDVGDGMVIGFTQDPTLRAFMDGLNLLLVNAILIGPAVAAQ